MKFRPLHDRVLIEVLESENIPNYGDTGNFKSTTEVYV